MTYLTVDQILLIHSIVVDETGGRHGVRDYGLILSLQDAPRQAVFGKELYPSIFLKAAVYIRNIIQFHPFSDGNKRTAMIAGSVFLENNGCKIVAKKGEIEKLALRVAKEKLDIPMIASWLRKHAKKLADKK